MCVSGAGERGAELDGSRVNACICSSCVVGKSHIYKAIRHMHV